jgi:hypothetical protein
VVAFFASGTATADQAQIASVLSKEYKNKVVILRGFYTNSNLRFDSKGNPIGRAHPGYWSSDGMLQITDLSFGLGGVLRIGAKRIVNAFDDKRGVFQNVTTKNQVRIEVELDRSWQDATPVEQLLGKILSSDVKEVLDVLPDYWQWCAADGIHQGQPGDWKCGKPGMDETSTAPKFILPDGTAVYRVKNGVKPPKLIDGPDPEFSQAARTIHLQGTLVMWLVVDEKGIPAHLRILRPLGGGLDDNAAELLRTWRFRPGTLDGHPVPVQITVDVNFKLFQ